MNNFIKTFRSLLLLVSFTSLLTISHAANVEIVSISGCCVSFQLNFNDNEKPWVFYPNYPDTADGYSGSNPPASMIIEHCYENPGTYNAYFDHSGNGNIQTFSIESCDISAGCGVYIEEVVEGDKVIITLYHDDGTPISQYNDPCCVTWTGVPGVPTISCPPPPGLPAQSFNPVIVVLGEPYGVSITCDDCTFTYEGVAGDLEDEKADEKSKGADGQEELLSTKEAELNIFPNPASDYLELSGTQLIEGSIIEVFNMQGQLMTSKIVDASDNVSFSVSELTFGAYLLTLRTREGKLLTSKSFVIK